jgi:hypothetical protein
MFRHNLGHPKTTKKNTSNGGSHITMKKKVVHRLLIPLAHTTYVHHDDVPAPDIIQVRILLRAADHAKKTVLEGA